MKKNKPLTINATFLEVLQASANHANKKAKKKAKKAIKKPKSKQ